MKRADSASVEPPAAAAAPNPTGQKLRLEAPARRASLLLGIAAIRVSASSARVSPKAVVGRPLVRNPLVARVLVVAASAVGKSAWWSRPPLTDVFVTDVFVLLDRDSRAPLWWLLHPPWLPLLEENGASPLGSPQILGHPRLVVVGELGFNVKP